jgi:hypothetical protein
VRLYSEDIADLGYFWCAMSYQKELHEARETLTLSAKTATRFVAQLGAVAPVLIFPAATLGRRPGFQATVLDQKYWFAKLYEIVTYNELSYSTHTNYPGYSLHFMNVFYRMYFDALENFSARKFGQVSSLWMTHFAGPSDGDKVEADSKEAIQFSVRTGATAHIQGDMPLALADAYRTWGADPKPPFGELREDFITKSRAAFVAAQGQFYIDVNDKTFSPFRPEVGQLGAAYYQALFNIQPSLPIMFKWREDAWREAAKKL